MKFLKINLLSLCVMGLLVSGVQAFPFQDGPDMRKLDPEMLTRLTKRLDLNEEQTSKISALVEQSEAASESRAEELKQLKKSLRASAEGDEFDRKAVRKIADKISGLSADMMVDSLALRSDVRGLLTPEQREKMAEMRGRMKERHKQMGDKHKRGKKRHGGPRRGDRPGADTGGEDSQE